MNTNWLTDYTFDFFDMGGDSWESYQQFLTELSVDHFQGKQFNEFDIRHAAKIVWTCRQNEIKKL